MDSRYRRLFNEHYSEELYARMCALMDRRLETPRFEFRLAETPLLLPEQLKSRCEKVSREILDIIQRPDVLEACQAAVPARYDTPHPDSRPHFLAIDLGIVRGAEGTLEPRLIELQGFSSLYGMQLVQGGIWSEMLAGIPGMPARWTPLFSGLSETAYVELLRRTVIAGADPE